MKEVIRSTSARSSWTGARIFIVILTMLGMLPLVFAGGCFDKAVSAVKNGYFEGHDDVTVGKILDLRFSSGRWSSSSEEGRTVVKFTGKIRKDTRLLALNLLKAGQKEQCFDKMQFIKQYDVAAFEVGQKQLDQLLKPYQDEIQKLKDTDGKKVETLEHEYGSMQTEVYALEAKQQTEKLREAILVHGNDNPSAAKALQKENAARAVKIEELHGRMEKVDSEYSAAKEKYDKALKSLFDKKNAEESKIAEELLNDFINKTFWPEGSEVQFKWLVFPDGKNYQLTEVGSPSWAKFQQGVETIIAIICVKQE